jgi:hypothetical protein
MQDGTTHHKTTRLQKKKAQDHKTTQDKKKTHNTTLRQHKTDETRQDETRHKRP